MNKIQAYITKAACFLPGEPVLNQEMESLLGQIGDKPSKARSIVLRSNRIKSRHYAIDKKTLLPTHNNAELAAAAIRGLSGNGFSINDIQCLAAATSVPDQIAPNHAVMVHGELGIPPCEVIATAGICVCGMSAMKYAYMAVTSGMYTNAVASASELASSIMHARNFDAEHQSKVEALKSNPEIAFEKDFLRWMLSDGAGAVLIQPAPKKDEISLQIEWIDIRSYANEMETCMYAGAEKIDGKIKGWNLYTSGERAEQSIMSVKQDVKLLNNNVIHYTLEKPLSELIHSRNLNKDNIDWFLPHYSSDYFREKVYAGLQTINFEIPYEKWFSNLSDKGNTGSASIYIMLATLMESGKLKSGDRILCYIPESGRFSSSFMLLTAV